MRQFNKFRGTKGFVSIWYQALRFRYMITEQAKNRCHILAFWEKHGIEATAEAFDISERTLFRWQRALHQSEGKLDGLNPKSTAPHKRNKRVIPRALEEDIIRLRTEHPGLGKSKLFPLLSSLGHETSATTVGRILSDLKKKQKLPDSKKLSLSGNTGILRESKPKKRKKKLRRPKGYRVLEVDTVVRFIHGVKRYVVTGIDTETRTAFAACYTNHGSYSAADFLKKAMRVLPDCPTHIQTDNGSEFALHFEHACEQLGLTHYHTYPKSPKMNAHVERFNRTIDSEFLVFNKPLMRDDVSAFNEKLVDWLLWYNEERPHFSLGQKSPFQAMMEKINPPDCHMWWTHTNI
jgi:transposase InsO family protein